jgi:hypothetical protein
MKALNKIHILTSTKLLRVSAPECRLQGVCCNKKIPVHRASQGTDRPVCFQLYINPSNAELNPIRHLLALVGARHIVHVSRIRVKYL